MKTLYTLSLIFINIWAFAQTNLAFQYKNLKNTPINALSVQNGNEIIAATEKGLFRISNFDASANQITTSAISKLDYDKNNQVWLGLYSNQISSINNQIYDIGISKTNIINVLTIIEDNVWIGTNNGVYSFSLKKMKEMPHFTTRNSRLAGNQINAIESDAKGRIWIGTNRGLSIFDGKNWETFHKEKQVTAIERNGNDMWIAASKGLMQYGKNKTWTSVALPINYAFHTIRDLAFDFNGDLWIASKHVLKYERLTKTFFIYDENTGFESTMALCLAIDNENQVWVGTAGKGLYKIQNEEPELPIANNTESVEQTVIINQPPSKPEFNEIVAQKEPEIVIKNNPKKKKVEKSKAKRKRFSLFSDSEVAANDNTEKSGFAKNRTSQKVKNKKVENENANINFLGSRLIKDGIEIEVEEMQLEIAIWDGQNMDGDSVSLYYNGTCILKDFNLTKERQYFKLDINPRIDNSLILYAHSNGELGYSTATIAIEGQDTETKWIVLNSDVKKCDRITFKFVY